MKKTISIGNQDFRSIREQDCFYIDKTSFIKEWWDNRDVVTLITRPRRFGKTLNLSMLDCFFSVRYAGRADLFEGLSIWEDEGWRKLQGSMPVIFLSFADIKAVRYSDARLGIIQKLLRLYSTHSYVRTDDILGEEDRRYLESFSMDMSDAVAAASLNFLSELMQRYYGRRVLILLDEYDTPLQEAYLHGYWDEMAGFIRSLFNAAFKTNPYLERGLLTGITRVSRESIFSDLNNLEVVTTTSEKYQTSFGFTQDEVRGALLDYGMADQADKVSYWYDGFHFGSCRDIYNPWSITKLLDSGKFAGYWANTSSNALAGQLIREGSAELKMKMQLLLEGKEIRAAVDEELSYYQLGMQEDAVWSLLLASGYLKVMELPEEEDGSYRLAITNHEVSSMFRKMIRAWFDNPSARYNDFVKAMLAGDLVHMNRFMDQMAQTVFSYFDTGNRPSGQEPERFYHGFVLGLIADARLEYYISSNRESGFGRYDVVMEPKNKGGYAYILEFKVHDPYTEKTLRDTVDSALAQIKEKRYSLALVSHGIPEDKIRCYGFAFEGKKVLIG